ESVAVPRRSCTVEPLTGREGPLMRRMAWAGLAIGAAAVAPLPVSAMPASAMPQVDAEGSIAARGGEAVRFEDAASLVDSRLPFSAEPDAAFGAPVQFNNASRLSAETGQLRQEAWFAGDGFTDRLRITTTGELRHADGSPAPPRALDPVAFSGESYDVTYTRGWTAA